MQFLEYTIDTSKLLTKAELLELIKEHGETNWGALSEVRERYHAEFGNELVWNYVISDGVHTGTFIILVQEGFISIPYNAIDAEDYEILELQDALMLDEDAIQFFIDDWVSFSDDLLTAMKAMQRVITSRSA